MTDVTQVSRVTPCVSHARVTDRCHAVPSRPVPSRPTKRDSLWSVVSEFGLKSPLRPKRREVSAA